jgi:hypothetical protein
MRMDASTTGRRPARDPRAASSAREPRATVRSVRYWQDEAIGRTDVTFNVGVLMPDEDREALDAPGFVVSCGVEPGAAPGAAVLLAAVFATVPVISTLWFTCWLRFTLESADSVYSSNAAVALDDRVALELALESLDALLAPDPIETSVSLNALDDDAPGEACWTQPVTVMGWLALLDRLCVAVDDCA